MTRNIFVLKITRKLCLPKSFGTFKKRAPGNEVNWAGFWGVNDSSRNSTLVLPFQSVRRWSWTEDSSIFQHNPGAWSSWRSRHQRLLNGNKNPFHTADKCNKYQDNDRQPRSLDSFPSLGAPKQGQRALGTRLNQFHSHSFGMSRNNTLYHKHVSSLIVKRDYARIVRS